MKKLSDMKSGETGFVLYLPYHWHGDGAIHRYEYVKVIINLFGNMFIKTEHGYRLLMREDSSQITCR